LERAQWCASPEQLQKYRDAQQALWRGIRENGNPWLITDLITVGSPMYFADRLYTRNHKLFLQRVKATEFPTCPPESDPAEYNNIHHTKRWYSYEWPPKVRRVLYHGAPFAVVRWTNMWFPAHFWFFGDWFGGRLSPLYGPGIKDIRLTGNKRRWTWFPAVAHATYFSFPDDDSPDSVTKHLHDAMALASGAWLSQVKPPGRPPGGARSTRIEGQQPAAQPKEVEAAPAIPDEPEPAP
jgi:hypothetical protein